MNVFAFQLGVLGFVLWAGGTTVAQAAPEQNQTANASVAFYEATIQPLLDTHCVMCHMTGSAQGGLVLEAGLSFSALVGRPSTGSPLLRVKAGDAGSSYLLHKLKGTHVSVGGSGSAMPPGDPLDDASIRLMEQWISQGI
jgi:mono/diheme cytochrome c family protein